MKLLKELKKLNESLYINNYVKGYINKSVFRLGFFVMLLLLMFIIYSENLVSIELPKRLYVNCPDDSIKHCKNPYYQCDEFLLGKDPCKNLTMGNIDNCLPYNLYEIQCLDIINCYGICDQEYIEPGNYLGKKPGLLYENYQLIVTIIIFLTIGINHLLYIRGDKNKISDKSKYQKR